MWLALPLLLAVGWTLRDAVGLHNAHATRQITYQSLAMLAPGLVLAAGQWWAGEIRRNLWLRRAPSSQTVRRRSR